MDEQPDPGCHSQMMKDRSHTASSLRAPLMAQDLTPEKRSLMELMRAHQFGRIENMPVRAGQPILNGDVEVVRVARMGGGHVAKSTTLEFELKEQVADLFQELARLDNGTVIRLEFRHGLPFLLETASTVSPATRL